MSKKVRRDFFAGVSVHPFAEDQREFIDGVFEAGIDVLERCLDRFGDLRTGLGMQNGPNCMNEKNTPKENTTTLKKPRRC